MKYKIEVDYVAGVCRVTHYPKGAFECPGEPIDACNLRMAQILEQGINRQNLIRARLYLGDNLESNLVLEVDYRRKKLKLNLSNGLEDFWIKI
jgi:hypothetical protein